MAVRRNSIKYERGGKMLFDEFDNFPRELREFIANLPYNCATDDLAEALTNGHTVDFIMEVM